MSVPGRLARVFGQPPPSVAPSANVGELKLRSSAWWYLKTWDVPSLGDLMRRIGPAQRVTIRVRPEQLHPVTRRYGGVLTIGPGVIYVTLRASKGLGRFNHLPST